MKKFIITEQEKDEILGHYNDMKLKPSLLSKKLVEYELLKREVINLILQELANTVVIPILFNDKKLNDFYLGHGTFYFKSKKGDIIYNDEYDKKVSNFIRKYDNNDEFGLDGESITINREGLTR